MLECNLASGCTVDVAGIQGWQAGNAQFRSSVPQSKAFQTFFSRTTVTIQNMQAYR